MSEKAEKELPNNSGIVGDCDFCAQRGFVYHNESLESNLTMCDRCRDDMEHRRRSFDIRTRLKAAAVNGGV